ncbi:hypothetical protein INR49_028663 [Caranx melampygus]|nr:hypothetical protein INR49_028663 [Caranx melampygus]
MALKQSLIRAANISSQSCGGNTKTELALLPTLSHVLDGGKWVKKKGAGRRVGGWLDLESKRARDRTQPSNGLARQAKINSRPEESIQRACQWTVKLPSMMDSLDVHSLFAARLWSAIYPPPCWYHSGSLCQCVHAPLLWPERSTCLGTTTGDTFDGDEDDDEDPWAVLQSGCFHLACLKVICLRFPVQASVLPAGRRPEVSCSALQKEEGGEI